MRLYLLQEKTKNKEFYIYWDKGQNYYADYHTKHFPSSYYKNIRLHYILKGYHVK